MNTSILASAAGLSDRDLLARLETLAGKEREASVELIAHLAALDIRPAVYAAQGYGSLFSYCTQALRLSEDAACNRIEAARTCRRFPVILELLTSGSLTLTSVRLLGRHLTAENYRDVLARASGRSRPQLEALVAELAPQPDAPASVRKLPVRSIPGLTPSPLSPAPSEVAVEARIPGGPSSATNSASLELPTPAVRGPAESVPQLVGPPVPLAPTPRGVVQATAPERYRVQFTIGSQAHEKLRRVQALLRREIPDGDPGAIFERALDLLLDRVEKTKLAVAAKPRPQAAIRRGTDSVPTSTRSRHIPREVKRGVWQRDGGQCAFVSAAGRRCTERTFLEFHHIQPYARQGPATVMNISLRCRRHNQHEAELAFGPRQLRSSVTRVGASPMLVRERSD